MKFDGYYTTREKDSHAEFSFNKVIDMIWSNNRHHSIVQKRFNLYDMKHHSSN